MSLFSSEQKDIKGAVFACALQRDRLAEHTWNFIKTLPHQCGGQEALHSVVCRMKNREEQGCEPQCEPGSQVGTAVQRWGERGFCTSNRWQSSPFSTSSVLFVPSKDHVQLHYRQPYEFQC